MQVKLDLERKTCTVTREAGDPKFTGVINAAGESRLLHHIKLELNKQGFDMIKKRMWKDGHLVDDMQQYIRSRKIKPGAFCIFNNQWAIRGAEEYLNEFGQVTLMVEVLA